MAYEHRPPSLTLLAQVGQQHLAPGAHGVDAAPLTQGELQRLQPVGHVVGRADRLLAVHVAHSHDRCPGHRQQGRADLADPQRRSGMMIVKGGQDPVPGSPSTIKGRAEASPQISATPIRRPPARSPFRVTVSDQVEEHVERRVTCVRRESVRRPCPQQGAGDSAASRRRGLSSKPTGNAEICIHIIR